jgi:hypothetical protein
MISRAANSLFIVAILFSAIVYGCGGDDDDSSVKDAGDSGPLEDGAAGDAQDDAVVDAKVPDDAKPNTDGGKDSGEPRCGDKIVKKDLN